MKKKMSFVVFIMTVILLITSCIEVQYSIKINDDSSQRIGVKIIMPAMFSVQSGEIIKKLNEEGYSASTKSEGDKFIVEGTKTTEKEAWLFPFPNAARNVSFEPSVKNYLFFKLFTFNGKYSLENKEIPNPNSPFASMAIPLKYSVEMPGSINSHNAGQFSGNILQWQYNMADHLINVDVQASSYTVNYFAITAFVVVMLVLIAITVLRPTYKKYTIPALLAILIAIPALIFLINIDDKIPTATQIQTQKSNQTQSSSAIVPNPLPLPPNPQTSQPVDLSKYVGKHPKDVFEEKEITEKFKALLGKDYKQFIGNLEVSSSLELKGDFYVGEGCAPHSCSIDESAFVINKVNGVVHAIILVEGKEMYFFGANSAKNLPAPLYAWYKEHGGQN